MKFIVLFAIAVGVTYADDEPVAILKQVSDLNPDGSYEWSFEAANGIIAQETGQLTDSEEPGTAAKGSFEYMGPDGVKYQVTYIADENGFQPQGEHLPTPPPIPEVIARALNWVKEHPEPESMR